MDIPDKIQKGPSPFSGLELDAAKIIFNHLLLTCKNLSIFPHNNATCINSMNQFHTQLSGFLQRYGSLKFEIERERIIFKEGMISQGITQEGSLHFTLFQVGIRWLEFLPGIEPEESLTILKILGKYFKSPVADGDIVTAFWEAQFPHLQYEVADFIWGAEFEKIDDISNLTAEKETGERRKIYRDEPEIQGEQGLKLANLLLTPQEKENLKEMVLQEGKEDMASYLDVLMDSLLGHREKENFNLILGVLSEELKVSLDKKDFFASFNIMHGLQNILEMIRGEIPWAGQFIETFFENVSLEVPDILMKNWQNIDPKDSGILGQIFKYLSPKAIPTLVSLLEHDQPAPLRVILSEAILSLASKDINPLETVLDQVGEKAIEKLIPIMIKLEGDQSLRCLMRLARHPSAHVRNEAAKSILRRDPAYVKEIFSMIDLMEETTRLMILNQLGRSRYVAAEDLLLSYLRNIKFTKNETDFIFLCFKTLGKCGSSKSVPFLREMLFNGGLMPGFRNSVLRIGATLALVLLNNPEAESVLGEAGRSLNPGLRMVIKKIKREMRPRGRS
jgi:hypothetical protein